VELLNGLRIQNVRHTPSIKVNLIALADLRHYKPRYLWETAEFLLYIDDTTTIRVPISDRLWLMHFKAIPTPKPRTPKQNAQEAQILTKAPAIAIITAATTVTTTAATTAITIIATIATRTTTKKGKAKGRALLLKRWHKRLNHLNYANVKQLATNSSQIKLANNKELFCESCAYSKQHVILNHEPQIRAEAIFDLIHVNLGGDKNSLLKTNSRMLTFNDDIPPIPKGAKYFMIITDDYSRYR
jgi:GAG-pre-integrase domain